MDIILFQVQRAQLDQIGKGIDINYGYVVV